MCARRRAFDVNLVLHTWITTTPQDQWVLLTTWVIKPRGGLGQGGPAPGERAHLRVRYRYARIIAVPRYNVVLVCESRVVNVTDI